MSGTQRWWGNWGFLLFVPMLASGLLCGCDSPEPAKISSPVGVERVVSLAPSLTEIAVTLGRGGRLVGVTEFCHDVPANVARVGGLQVELEAVVSLSPDLVLAIETRGQSALVTSLRQLGIPVEVLRAESVADVANCIERLGTLLESAEISKEHLRLLRPVAQAPKPDAEAPQALFVVDWSPLFVAGGGSFVSEMLTAAGLRNVFAGQEASYLAVDLEEVFARDPDLIIDSSGQVLERWQRFGDLRAVREGRLHGFEKVWPGVRIPAWVEQLKAIADVSRNREQR